jgi:hypothetical protein
LTTSYDVLIAGTGWEQQALVSNSKPPLAGFSWHTLEVSFWKMNVGKVKGSQFEAVDKFGEK